MILINIVIIIIIIIVSLSSSGQEGIYGQIVMTAVVLHVWKTDCLALTFSQLRQNWPRWEEACESPAQLVLLVLRGTQDASSWPTTWAGKALNVVSLPLRDQSQGLLSTPKVVRWTPRCYGSTPEFQFISRTILHIPFSSHVLYFTFPFTI